MSKFSKKNSVTFHCTCLNDDVMCVLLLQLPECDADLVLQAVPAVQLQPPRLLADVESSGRGKGTARGQPSHTDQQGSGSKSYKRNFSYKIKEILPLSTCFSQRESNRPIILALAFCC